MLEKIRIILIQTSHPGNIGSAARAMKTMGLTDLYLVSPLQFPHVKANEMASGALDILANAKVVDTMDKAMEGCDLICGTSARSRSLAWPLLTPRALADKIRLAPSYHSIGIIFGRENSGLTNEELQRCHFHVQIPSHPDYGSLNLGAAVQVIAYELRVASLMKATLGIQEEKYAVAQELQLFYEHLERVLVALDFLNPEAPKRLLPRLRRLFNRAEPDFTEINILRGILTAVEKSIK